MTFWTEGLQTSATPKVLEDYSSGTALSASFGAGISEGLGLGLDTMTLDQLQNGQRISRWGGRHAPSTEVLPPAEVDRQIQASGVTLKEVPPNVTAGALDFMLQRQHEKQVRDDLLNRAPSGLFATPARFAVRFAANMMDPINVASAFVPVIGPERYAAMLAKAGFVGRTAIRAGVGAAEGAVGQALIEPLRMAQAKGLGDDYTMNDSLANIAYGTVFGGGLHIMAGSVADALGWRTAKATTNLAKQIAAAPLEVRESLLKTAFSQMATGNEVNVQGMMDLHAAGETPVAAGPEKIAAAAIKVDDKVFTGTNHGEALDAAAKAGVDTENLASRSLETDGFVTTTGRYVTRKEASAIAADAGQIKGAPHMAEFLKSEGTIEAPLIEMAPNMERAAPGSEAAVPGGAALAPGQVAPDMPIGINPQQAAESVVDAASKPTPRLTDAPASTRADATVKDAPPAPPGETAEVDAAQASLDSTMEDITRLSKQLGTEDDVKTATKELDALDTDAKTYRRALEAAAVCGAGA